MQLSKHAVIELQELCEKHFGVRPSTEEAEREGLILIRLVALTQPTV